MDVSFLTLSRSMLLQGIKAHEMHLLMQCMKPETRKYKKHARIYCAGDIERAFGLILQGSVLVEQDSLWGNHRIFRHVEQGHIFAETYTFPPGAPLAFNIIAAESSEIMFWNASKMITPCKKSCPFHYQLIRNFVSVTANKSLELYRRINHISHRTIRNRLTSYLSDESIKQGSHHILIPFNRQQLADYLGVERSALSSELGKMQRDGLIVTKKNEFFLKNLIKATEVIVP